jgi:hypothetical protein
MMLQYTGGSGSVECSTSTIAKRRDVIARVFGQNAINGRARHAHPSANAGGACAPSTRLRLLWPVKAFVKKRDARIEKPVHLPVHLVRAAMLAVPR